MTSRRQILKAALLLPISSRSFSVEQPRLEIGARGNEPVIVVTPWGQHVVPTIDTYIDIETYRTLRPGQAWSEGIPIDHRLREDYRAGRLRLRRYPWRVMDGIYVLGAQGQEQQTYLVDTGDGLILIDPSLETWQDEIVAQIYELRYQPSDVRWVLLTHCHIDHSQACHQWRQRGAQIMAGEGDAHPLETCNSLVESWIVDSMLAEIGRPAPAISERCTPSPIDRLISDGDVLRLGSVTLHSISTPGHTPGSTCYYLARDKKHVLISGDIALHNGRHAWMANPYANWEQYLAALEKLSHFTLEGRRIHFDVLLPGHGTVDLEQAQRSVDETLRVVRTLVARRAAGEQIDWIDVYHWNWTQGVVYAPEGGGR